MKSKLTSAALSVAMTATTVAVIGLPTTPAQAIIVFDPSNYSQNILTAARTLTQINNQIRMLQNQATSLVNQARNLATISFPELQTIRQALGQIDQLMAQAHAIEFRVAHVDDEFRQLFPTSFDAALRLDQHAAAARTRLDAAMAAYKQTMTVQAQVAENVQADAQTLNDLVAKSQSAVGVLQASQATNQLIALATKQQFQIQSLMAAQYRAEATERARAIQGQADARAATAQFLGSGSAYTPQ